ncbi:MAG: tetratricopeptide repeat protein [Gemmatimonadales bacterium]
MILNLHAWTTIGCAAALSSAVPLSAQMPCPPRADSILAAGWRAYRADSTPKASERFAAAQRLCPENADASVGLGYAKLRLGDARAADALFSQVLSRDTTNADAWEGRIRSSLRLGDTIRAIASGQRALHLNPNNPEVRALLNAIAPEWEHQAPRKQERAKELQLVARTRGRLFEVLSGTSWRPFYVKGVNLGVALPGHYPSEFPADSAVYAGWFNALARMNANTLRLYTILPPSFYRALRAWNVAHPDRLLWLIHGVWTELPPSHDFNEPIWKRGFEDEMYRVVDLLHGSATIESRPGHAAGYYDADVSSWVLAYIIGREWEPFAVKAFNENAGGGYQGRYLQVQQAPAMDVWLAAECDAMLSYEVAAYNALRPIAYTNWPTLDPLHHPTEATTGEEAYWRRKLGHLTGTNNLEYDNDAVSLDANLVRATSANPAGWFASYHAYPYYPDFMNLDPAYRRARSSEGPSNYFGYLRDLVMHHPGIPTLIAEYGVPSSRGVAHFQAQGRDHGGHDEVAMATIDARLTREIREAGAAGSILFAWMDEWFKRNWAVMDYEIPPDNTRRWHNTMDPEQHYGILGQYAGDSGSSPRLGGNPSGWRRLALVQRADKVIAAAPRALRAGSDESFMYLAVELDRASFSWDSLSVQLAIDTHEPKMGQHTLPRTSTRSEIGFEFLVDLTSPDSASIQVLPEYNRYDARVSSVGDDYGRFSRRPVATRNRSDGRFNPELIIINRARFGRDGELYPAQRYDRGRLRYGTENSSTLSDWYYDRQAGILELRISWDLINVTDPSSRTLLSDTQASGDFGTASGDAFHFGVEVYRKNASSRVAGALPTSSNGVWSAAEFQPWRWRGWTVPRSHARLKPVYDSLRLLWQQAPPREPASPGRRAPSE